MENTRGFKGFDISARFARAVSLLEELGPVGDGAEEVAHVDVVEVVVGICPVERGIVDFELDIRGCPGRLGGRYVGADDGGAGKLVGKVDCPDPWREGVLVW